MICSYDNNATCLCMINKNIQQNMLKVSLVSEHDDKKQTNTYQYNTRKELCVNYG